MNLYLLISLIVILALLIIVNIYLLAYFCHPDDKGWGATLFCKALVIAGLTLSWAMVLLLPLDVANTRGYGGGLPMKAIWYIVILSVSLCAFLLIPFSIFYYETDEDATMTKRLCTATQLTGCTFVIISIVVFIMYTFFSTADIPVEACARNINTFTSSTSSIATAAGKTAQSCSHIELAINVSFVIFLMATITFVGMFLFVIFGGVGLFAMPLDMIYSFTRRPKFRNRKELMDHKKILSDKTTELIDLAAEIKEQKEQVDSASGYWARRKEKNKVKSMAKRLRKQFTMLKKEYDLYLFEAKAVDSNPLWYIFYCVIGILFLVVSFLWWIHILLFMVWRNANGYPLHTFLNRFFIKLGDSYFDFLGVAVFGGMALYLIWAVIKGNVKFGLRFVIFTFHPMKKNETWMNSFLFNVMLILISSCAVTQFCSRAFSQYTRLSTADLIFGQQINYLRCFKWFFKNRIFDYVILIWSIITMIFMIFKPQHYDLSAELKKQKEKQMEMGII